MAYSVIVVVVARSSACRFKEDSIGIFISFVGSSERSLYASWCIPLYHILHISIVSAFLSVMQSIFAGRSFCTCQYRWCQFQSLYIARALFVFLLPFHWHGVGFCRFCRFLVHVNVVHFWYMVHGGNRRSCRRCHEGVWLISSGRSWYMIFLYIVESVHFCTPSCIVDM